jgi:hypothetical protein
MDDNSHCALTGISISGDVSQKSEKLSKSDLKYSSIVLQEYKTSVREGENAFERLAGKPITGTYVLALTMIGPVTFSNNNQSARRFLLQTN